MEPSSQSSDSGTDDDMCDFLAKVHRVAQLSQDNRNAPNISSLDADLQEWLYRNEPCCRGRSIARIKMSQTLESMRLLGDIMDGKCETGLDGEAHWELYVSPESYEIFRHPQVRDRISRMTTKCDLQTIVPAGGGWVADVTPVMHGYVAILAMCDIGHYVAMKDTPLTSWAARQMVHASKDLTNLVRTACTADTGILHLGCGICRPLERNEKCFHNLREILYAINRCENSLAKIDPPNGTAPHCLGHLNSHVLWQRRTTRFEQLKKSFAKSIHGDEDGPFDPPLSEGGVALAFTFYALLFTWSPELLHLVLPDPHHFASAKCSTYSISQIGYTLLNEEGGAHGPSVLALRQICAVVEKVAKFRVEGIPDYVETGIDDFVGCFMHKMVKYNRVRPGIISNISVLMCKSYALFQYGKLIMDVAQAAKGLSGNSMEGSLRISTMKDWVSNRNAQKDALNRLNEKKEEKAAAVKEQLRKSKLAIFIRSKSHEVAVAAVNKVLATARSNDMEQIKNQEAFLRRLRDLNQPVRAKAMARLMQHEGNRRRR